jgi:hypothetical protein
MILRIGLRVLYAIGVVGLVYLMLQRAMTPPAYWTLPWKILAESFVFLTVGSLGWEKV